MFWGLWGLGGATLVETKLQAAASRRPSECKLYMGHLRQSDLHRRRPATLVEKELRAQQIPAALGPRLEQRHGNTQGKINLCLVADCGLAARRKPEKGSGRAQVGATLKCGAWRSDASAEALGEVARGRHSFLQKRGRRRGEAEVRDPAPPTV